MESVDVKDTETNINNNNNNNTDGKSIIDTINNNINCLIERLQSESEIGKIVECDESSLPSPKAMLETIMPCEKLCNNFRHIADDLSSESDVIKTQIKSEPNNEPKVVNSFDDEFNHEQYPLNLKALRFNMSAGQQKDNLNSDKMDQFKESDEYGPCDSPKAKKIFINMLDQMHSPSTTTKQHKMKSSEGKAMNISSPSSYNSSSPSSTSSLSSTSNVQHQKNAISGQALNGSMQEMLNLPNFSHLQQMPQLSTGLSQLQHRSTPLGLSGMNPGSPLMSGGVLLGLGLPQSPQLPQLILTSGQLVQGIQGAQVLVPTPQGITSQTILTIPVSQQLPTSLTIDQLLQALSNVSHKQQQVEQTTNTNHVLSNVPNLSPNPILLNSHLLASGAQQLLSIQPQLMAFQQQQQQQQQQQAQHHNEFYRKSQSHIQEGPESPSMHSRKDQMSMNQFKMRNREMSKRLSRMSRPLNGHGDLMTHHSSGSAGGSTSPNVGATRVPTTNGETRASPSKPITTETSSHHSPSHTKTFQPPPSTSPTPPQQQKLEFRAMRELLADDRRGEFPMDHSHCQSAEESSKKNSGHHSSERSGEKSNRGSPYAGSSQQQDNQPIQIPSSPVNLSNDSNSGDEHFGDGAQNDSSSAAQRESLPDGIDLDEINEFAQAFKLQRLSLGLTQTQVGQALSVTEGPAYSQSAICRFEKLDITPKSAQKIKPVLEQWMKEAKGSRFKMGENPLTEFMGVETSKKRKRRTSFTPHALEILNSSFERNTHPSGTDITSLAQALGYEREVIRIWFCNKRQALKNTVRMMSKGMPN
ncbi:hypothetical protein ACKWTF_015809 [Chironomus riparius]